MYPLYTQINKILCLRNINITSCKITNEDTFENRYCNIESYVLKSEASIPRMMLKNIMERALHNIYIVNINLQALVDLFYRKNCISAI